MSKAAFVYGVELTQRDSRVDEIFGPTRLQYTYELLMHYKAFDSPDSTLLAPEEVDETPLLTFHTSDYINAVRSLSNGENKYNPTRYNFSQFGDNPVYPGMYELSITVVGASLKAAELVSNGEVDVAFNCSGGLHHAAPDHASGFCVFNDVVIAIKYLLSQGLKVAYIDIDAHHGDGVQDAFYESDRVLTVSLHESGRYLFPGTGDVTEIGADAGKGYAVNIPLSPFTDDETYLWAFDQVVPALLDRFRPDILVTQLGTDSHYLDSMTQLGLTTDGYSDLVKRMSSMAPMWVALGGGGYEMSVVVRCWTLAYGLMLGRDWPDEVPADYQELYGLKRLRDNEGPQLSANVKDRAVRFARESVGRVQELLFPLHGLPSV
ncbi:MAG: acetoin utilization protein AcuC [Dehalococcoidia bacterium]|nr:MAG: acetoin utilization protein AcuC [Dehalococcoidia bacterium]